MISNSVHPFLSLLISLILFFGFYEIGKFAVSKFSLKSLIQNVSSCEYQYTSIGIVVISLILFPLVAFTNSAKFILITFSIILFIFGIKFLKLIKQIFFNLKIEKKDLFFYVFILIVSLYFLLALSPLTAADVLDYHSGVALNILRFDRYILLPEWFTGLQAGHGETLISLGFSVQFWFYGVKRLGVTQASLLQNLAPVFVMLIMLVLGNNFEVMKVIGGALVILAAVITQIENKSKNSSKI